MVADDVRIGVAGPDHPRADLRHRRAGEVDTECPREPGTAHHGDHALISGDVDRGCVGGRRGPLEAADVAE